MSETTPETPSEKTPTEAAAPEAATHLTFAERLRHTRAAGKKSWDEALGRARAYFGEEVAAAAPVAESAKEQAGEVLEATQQAAATWGEQVQTWAQGVLKRAPLTAAQERGARLLLSAVRRLRNEIETLEQNLEAAAPKSTTPAAA
ncbi:MAG TPA: hypothetical protein DEA08_07200 [Planctomycetes bacterium]|nr:hypothetical protein [Planctomycetota bacterium]